PVTHPSAWCSAALTLSDSTMEIYASPLRENATFVAIVQWGVFPVVAGAGLLMWIRPWLAGRTAEANSPSTAANSSPALWVLRQVQSAS
ncbi:MAG: hypothetical protein ACK5BI_07645, partial [Burkholderiales bacterium]